jgi:hypothetical protein
MTGRGRNARTILIATLLAGLVGAGAGPRPAWGDRRGGPRVTIYYGFHHPSPWGFWGWGWGWGWPYGPSPSLYGRTGWSSHWTGVKTDIEPEEAAVYLDGRLIGTADDFDGYPDLLYLARGQYRVEFRLEGYESYEVEIDAGSGRFFRLDRHLKKIPGASRRGTHESSEPPGGIVRYFIKQGGRAVPFSPVREIPPDEKAGTPAPPASGREAGPTVSPAPAAEPSSAPREARIVFDVSPDDAAIYVDDRFAGIGRELNALKEGLSVAAGEHRITISRPGYSPATLVVQAPAGGRVQARVDLKR